MIQRSQEVTEAEFSIGCNITLKGSKQMTHEQQAALMLVEAVRITIVDANDPDNVLFDKEVPAIEFRTGSVGFKAHERGLKFGTK